MLSDEEKEAIETVKFFKKMKWYSHAFDNGTEILSEDEKQDIDIVLNLIEKQQKEIEKKDKIIDLMAEQLAGLKNEVDILEQGNKDCFIPREYSDIDDCVKKKVVKSVL